MVASILSSTLWLIYFYFASSSILFSCVSFLLSVFFSYWLAEELLFQRQTDPQISFILVNPNAMVYCTFYLFISCWLIFSIVFFTLNWFAYLKAFFSKQVFCFYFFSVFYLFFLFFFSYIVVDRDISNTFLLIQPKSIAFDINTVTQPELAYSFTSRPWEFSLYFFQFFGIFFDFFVTFTFIYSLYILFWWFNCKFYITNWSYRKGSNGFNRNISEVNHPLFPDFISSKPSFLYVNSFSWVIRRCIFAASFYFYSGEGFNYDRITFSSIMGFIEISFFFSYLIRSLHRYWNKQIN